jgi:V/A-type H+-transporting ATPase subunit F
LAREGYNIIMVTENLAASMQDVMREFQNEPVPSIVPIPSTLGSEGFALTRLREAIKRAVGTDILAER